MDRQCAAAIDFDDMLDDRRVSRGQVADAYFAAVADELNAESQRAALEGEFAPEVQG